MITLQVFGSIDDQGRPGRCSPGMAFFLMTFPSCGWVEASASIVRG